MMTSLHAVRTSESQLKQAEAQLRRGRIGIETARSLVTQREAEHTAAERQWAQREAQLDAAQRRLARSPAIDTKHARFLKQVLDGDRADRARQTAVGAAKAQLAATEAAARRPQRHRVIDAEASVSTGRQSPAFRQISTTPPEGSETGARSSIASPSRAGAFRRRTGAPTLSMSAMFHMTFPADFCSSRAGRHWCRARIVLDAAPQYVIPANINFVADVAQFTPKTVETGGAPETDVPRQGEDIAELLQKYIQQVKQDFRAWPMSSDPNASGRSISRKP